MIRALIFDLDDTLYPAGDFVASGYRAVADRLSAGCGAPGAEIHRMMMSTLAREGKLRVLPAALERYRVPALQLDDLVRIYRRHTPRIRMYAGYGRLLRRLRADFRLGVLTDGLPYVQRSKCSALGLEKTIDNIICSWEYGPERAKPHPYPFCVMMACLQVQPEEAVVIGDSIEKDCRGARGVGMKCVRVERRQGAPRPAGGGEADFIVASLLELPRVLKQLEGGNEAA
jgi:putative hydrolase of the HAD superfamily